VSSSRLARRYARALIELAEKGQVEQWGTELDRLAAMVEAPELFGRLTSPELSDETRQMAIAKIAEKLELSYPLRSFAVVLARHGRIAEIGRCAEAYRDMADALFGRVRATLTFASEPSDAEVQRVAAGLESIARKKVIPTVKVETSLLGGVVAELGGKIYDGSLATRLIEAQRKLASQA
jgi:F-type H+-transporting ATPase subunit delta